MNLIRIAESDDFTVDYNKDSKMYRVSVFKNNHFQDEYRFDAYTHELVHAKWEMVIDDLDDGYGEREYPHCSNCHIPIYRFDARNWCPNCGAIMDGII